MAILVASLLISSSFAQADDPKSSATHEAEASLKALVERLEARVTELETQIDELKHNQQRATIGSRLLELSDPQEEMLPFDRRIWIMSERLGIDEHGTIRSHRGRPLGYWGIDYSPTQDRW